ncbi:hypothetical protein ACWDG1_45910 [Streptomyces sp. NPDC001177]
MRDALLQVLQEVRGVARPAWDQGSEMACRHEIREGLFSTP